MYLNPPPISQKPLCLMVKLALSGLLLGAASSVTAGRAWVAVMKSSLWSLPMGERSGRPAQAPPRLLAHPAN